MSRADASILDRASRYVATMDPSISGQRGHDRAYAVAMVLIQGFALTVDESWPIFEEFSRRCSPPWSDSDIRHKLESAAQNANPAKVGHLIEGNDDGEYRPKPRTTPPPVAPKPAAFAKDESEISAILKRRGTVEKAWKYEHPITGAVEEIVVRYKVGGDKRYSPWIPSAAGWTEQHPQAPRPIYNRQRVMHAKNILVVEGEKCVSACHDLAGDAFYRAGWAATTSSGGNNSAHLADWNWIAGKRVVIWPDHDAPDKKGNVAGQKYAATVKEIAEALNPPATVEVIDPVLLGIKQDGSDVADFLDDQRDLPEGARVKLLLEAIDSASTSDDPAEELERHYRDIETGVLKILEWPHYELSRITRALIPGSVVLFCGSAGASKSFFLLQCMAYWFDQGEHVALYELEDPREYHMKRVHAQRSRMSNLTDFEWVRRNGKQVMAAMQAEKKWLSAFGRCITATADGVADDVTLDSLAEWVESKAARGARVIGIDPVTVANSGPKPWLADLRFINSIKRSASRHGCSVVLVTHPKKGSQGGTGLDDLAGGAAYARLSHCVLWLEYLPEPETVKVKRSDGQTFDAEINRVIVNRKSRGGVGVGRGVGFYFEPDSLCFAEQGVIVPPQKTKKTRY